MDWDEEDLGFAEQGHPLTRLCKSVFNAVFMTLFRPFNSREVSVEKSTRAQSRGYYKYEQVGRSGLSLMTENYLRGNLLYRLLKKDPLRILATLQESYRISRDTAYLLIAADLCRFFAARGNVEKRIQYHLSSLCYCHQAFAVQKGGDVRAGMEAENYLFLQEIQIFNEATAGIFRYLKEMDLLDSRTFTLRGIDGVEFIFEGADFQLSVPRSAVADFSLCSDYSVKALRLINRHSGIGVPLVAKVAETKLSRTLRTPPGLTIPVTLSFRIRTRSERKFVLAPHYQDTSVKETCQGIDMLGQPTEWSLARDFTAPLACFMGAMPRRNLLSGMLHPVKYDEYTGLYMVEPYHPEKIPVVFIHGLMSSPETWGQMINMLKYDPEIRRKYQFWFYYYSTGAPVLYSAKRLQQLLLKAQEEYCTTPEADRNFRRMVLVGHSMGGLITRLLLQQNPYRILEFFSGKSMEEIRKLLMPEDEELLEQFILIHPLPFVRRAVFMAVPHRGSAMATRSIANLGIKLIRMPKSILSKADHVKHIIDTIMPGADIHWKEHSFITGIDNLNPGGIFVRWAGDAPLKPDVVCHSIIGNRKKEVPGGSDGIVPYKSSHLDGVVSECIVRSDHGVHREPSAMRELLRILLLHLKECGVDDETPQNRAL